MVTKIVAARIAMSAGCRMVITKGSRLNPLKALEKPVSEGGAPCSWFLSDAEPRTARKAWIAGHLNPAGVLIIDAGAAAALDKGASLLPAGVRTVDGEFQRGDLLVIRTADGREVARGLSAYASDDARRIIGRKSRDIEAILGYRGRDEMIHRDDLVVG